MHVTSRVPVTVLTCVVPGAGMLRVAQVALTAILWGCGTAVGEVPPYFLSYKAASAGRRNEAYHEIQQALQQGTSGTLLQVLSLHRSSRQYSRARQVRCRGQVCTLGSRARAQAATQPGSVGATAVACAWRMGPCATGWPLTDAALQPCCCVMCCAGKQTGIFAQIVAAMQAWMMRVIQQHGFYGILLLASWPNAAFDLCGICCGAFMMPFWEFFGATLIGKGVIKVSGQSMFFVALFRWAACVCVWSDGGLVGRSAFVASAAHGPLL